jgi:multiple antibiotic resistance protein
MEASSFRFANRRASQVHKLLGVTGLHVVTRVFGVLLSALAVQFIFNGIADSGLLGKL